MNEEEKKSLLDDEDIQENEYEDYAASIETEQEMSTEELSTSESIDSEAAIEITVIENETTAIEEIKTVSVVSDEETSQSAEANVQEALISGNESMEFTEISDTVTAKDVTNLRSVPNTLDEGNIVSQLMNGEAVSRNGILYNAERICKSPYRAKYIRRGINSKMPVS